MEGNGLDQEPDWKDKFFTLLNEFNSLKDSMDFLVDRFYTYGTWIHGARKHLSLGVQDHLDSDHLSEDLCLVRTTMRCPRCGWRLENNICRQCRVKIVL